MGFGGGGRGFLLRYCRMKGVAKRGVKRSVVVRVMIRGRCFFGDVWWYLCVRGDFFFRLLLRLLLRLVVREVFFGFFMVWVCVVCVFLGGDFFFWVTASSLTSRSRRIACISSDNFFKVMNITIMMLFFLPKKYG